MLKTIPLAPIHLFTKQIVPSLYQESLTRSSLISITRVFCTCLINSFLPSKFLPCIFLGKRCTYHCDFCAKPSAFHLAIPSLLKEVSNRSMQCSAPGSTFILAKTAATTALPLACTTLKPKVQSCNPAHYIFLLTTTFMYSCWHQWEC